MGYKFGATIVLAVSLLVAPALAEERNCRQDGIEVPNDYGIPIAWISGDFIQTIRLTLPPLAASKNTSDSRDEDDVRRSEQPLESTEEITRDNADWSNSSYYVRAFDGGPCLDIELGPRIPMGDDRAFQTRLTVNNSALDIRYGAGVTIRDMQKGTRTIVPASFKYELPRDVGEQMVHLTPDGWSEDGGLNEMLPDVFEMPNLNRWDSDVSHQLSISAGTPNTIEINTVDWTALFMVMVKGGEYTGASASRKLTIDGKDHPFPLYSKRLTILPPGKVKVSGDESGEAQLCDVSKAQIAALMEQLENSVPNGLNDFYVNKLASEGHFNECYGGGDAFQSARTIRFGHRLGF
ncbi:MAG: hypothetical protein AAGA89_15290 [Pseudomonadota bacterium]